MKKPYISLVLAGVLAVTAPLFVYAEDGADDNVPQQAPSPAPVMMQREAVPGQAPQQRGDDRGMPRVFRAENVENNRDIRNAALRRGQNVPMMASSTRLAPMMLRAENRDNADEDSNDDRPMIPAWITASSSPFREHRLGSTTMMELMRAAREGTTTELRGHEMRKAIELASFARLQGNLISQLNQSLSRLQESRNKIADRITAATQSGRDMTDATKLLAVADQKIADAEKAVQNISTLTPSVSGTTVTASTTVSLEKPREIGKTAIQAVNEARKALNEVVVAIAHAMGFSFGEDGRIVPPTATSTPATASSTPTTTTTATTTQQ